MGAVWVAKGPMFLQALNSDQSVQTGLVLQNVIDACTSAIKDSEQPAYSRILIRVFDGCCLGSQGYSVSSDASLKL